MQGSAQVIDADAAACHALRVHLHQHRPAGATQGLHVAGAGHALDVGLHAVRHALKFISTGVRAAAVQGEGDDGYIVNALGLDQWLHHAQTFGQPVAVAAHGVVQAHQGFVVRHADLELHRQHRHTGA